jgi:hypothetical protein
MMFRRDFRSLTPCAALLICGIVLAMVASLASAKKYPEPSPYPLVRTFWYLKFKHAIPMRIAVALPGRAPAPYWYLPYTVTNDSGNEVEFVPQFEMVTQDGKVHRSDKGIPLAVFQAIKKREGNKLLLSAAQIAGPLHQGEDQAKDGVAIWEEPMPRMGEFSIYVGGLSNEFVNMTDDDGKPLKDADGQQIILRKTLQLNFVIWGDEVKPDLDEVHGKPERWVMR